MYNFILRFLLEGYLEYTIASFINLYYEQYSKFTEIFSFTVSVLMISIAVGLPIFSFLFILINFKDLDKPRLKDKFETLYENLDTSRRVTSFYTLIFLLRRLMFSFLAIFGYYWPFLQLVVTTYFSLGLLTFIIAFKPFSNSLVNKLEIFNEATLLVVCYCFFFFLD